MLKDFNPNRYSIITEKNKREIVMLRGQGCTWRRCRFCDYHLDSDKDPALNYALNKEQLDKVTGIYKKLEVINSGSFVDLDKDTMALIASTCVKNNISELHFECHWNHRHSIAPMKEAFLEKGIMVKVKTGVETFDTLFRESYLIKGIDTDSPSKIAQYFDECCLLQGIPGQTVASMLLDISVGLAHFERVCVNMMQNNKTSIKADPNVIELFMKYIYPVYKNNDRVDILLENTAFGVGGVTTHE